MLQLAKNKVFQLWEDPLHRNSLFLMGSTAMMAGSGFFFWIIASHVYTRGEIGLGGSLISLTNLLTSVACIGLPTALVRFLPGSSRPNTKISTAVILTGCTSFLVAAGFWLFSRVWLTEVFTLISSPLSFLAFAISIMFASWQLLGDAIFMVKKAFHWIFFESIVFSTSKLTFVFPLVFLGGLGVFLSNFGSATLATLVSFLILVFRFKIKIRPQINLDVLRELGKYSLATYLAGLIGTLPAQILPALIANSIGAESAANFFLALMMVNLLVIIPQASNQTIFAAASSGGKLKELIMKSLQTQIFLMSCGILGLWILGGVILSFFGKDYVAETHHVLRILSLSVIPLAIIHPLSTRLRVRKKMNTLVAITILGTISVLVSCFIGSQNGLSGVALGYVVGHLILSLLYVIEWKFPESTRYLSAP